MQDILAEENAAVAVILDSVAETELVITSYKQLLDAMVPVVFLTVGGGPYKVPVGELSPEKVTYSTDGNVHPKTNTNLN